MIDTRSTNGESHNTKLVKIVKKLIAAKIQYIEHEQDFLYSSFEDLSHFNTDLLDQIQSSNRLRNIKMRLDNFIQEMDKLSHSRELLLLIQPLIKEETARAVFELLSNDKYLFYSSQMLQRLLNLETYMAEQYYSSTEN